MNKNQACIASHIRLRHVIYIAYNSCFIESMIILPAFHVDERLLRHEHTLHKLFAYHACFL